MIIFWTTMELLRRAIAKLALATARRIGRATMDGEANLIPIKVR